MSHYQVAFDAALGAVKGDSTSLDIANIALKAAVFALGGDMSFYVRIGERPIFPAGPDHDEKVDAAYDGAYDAIEKHYNVAGT
jgi:hypothetical protein